jgi:type II secretion system protein G
MMYKCPYCQALMEALPRDGRCGACGRVMRLPPASTSDERAARRRRRERMVFDAERRIAELRQGPNARVLYSPKVLFGFLLIFTIVGAMLVRRANPRARVQPELPHQVALRQLNTLATALGRYRFHVGEFPPDTPGLQALLNAPGVQGWDGPYLNQVRPDPWMTPYRYAYMTNGVPKLFSCGPDRTPATPDDLRPDPAAFDPGTAWTNGWVSAIYRRTIVVVKEPQ